MLKQKKYKKSDHVEIHLTITVPVVVKIDTDDNPTAEIIHDRIKLAKLDLENMVYPTVKNELGFTISTSGPIKVDYRKGDGSFLLSKT